MMEKIENNVVNLIGIIVNEPEFSHEIFSEGFYTIKLGVARLSNSEDLLPITLSERLINDMNLKVGDAIIVEGQLRSYNKMVDGANKLILTIFARKIYFAEDEISKNPNQIYLDGYICKKPMYRTTPFGREITDLLVAVNRPYNKSDYIPCISWGRNAKFSEKLFVGDKIKIWGRIQSREYQKKLSEEESIIKIAYEVSISKMEVENKIKNIITENSLD